MSAMHEFKPVDPNKSKRPLYIRVLSNLTFWVLIAITLGIYIGSQMPHLGFDLGTSLNLKYAAKAGGEIVKDPNLWEFMSTKFIDLIKIFIPPIIFLTIVLGIAGMGDMKKVGRIGIKALVYFEVVTTLALIIGVGLAFWLTPGHLSAEDNAAVQETLKATAGKVDKTINDSKEGFSFLKFFLENITIQVLVAAIVGGIALNFSRYREKVIHYLEFASKYVFMALKYVMYLAPVAAFSGMAFTISKYGLKTLVPLAKLMGTVYATMGIFIFLVLGGILWYYRIRIWHVLKYIRQELLIVLGTSSSEPALPSIMKKLENAGCSKSVVGLVVPTGYSFNLDGTSIYLSMAVIFLAQFHNVHLSFGEIMGIIGLLVVTSKGAAGVTGSGFIVLASTLTALHKIPVEGLGLLFGVDKFMSEARAITNLIGNTVATLVISKSEKEFDVPNFSEASESLPNN